jgi:Lipocalin-like domain
MMRFFALAVVVYCYLAPGLALAQDTARRLAGSWKLTSWTIQIIGGDVTEPFGRNPKGRALITPDRYAAFVIAAANRKPAATDAESAALLKTHSWFIPVHSQSRTTSLRPRSTYPGMSF